MRNITQSELHSVTGAAGEYTASFIGTNAITGAIVGFFCPGLPVQLGLARHITNPCLAGAALYAGYAAFMLGAQEIDKHLISRQPAVI